MRIEDIPSENRPRERFQKFGANILSDAELLAIIIRTGTREKKGVVGESAIDTSNRLIKEYGLDKLSDCSLKEFQKIKGIGPAKAMQIMALFEFNKRHSLSMKLKIPIESAKDIFDYVSNRLIDKDKEHFMVLHLDSKNRIIKDEIISIGTLNASLTHPREIFKSAIKESSNAIILVHNHPSGDPSPSRQDIEITEKLFEAGKLLGINVLDHVIVGKSEYYSFKEKRI